MGYGKQGQGQVPRQSQLQRNHYCSAEFQAALGAYGMRSSCPAWRWTSIRKRAAFTPYRNGFRLEMAVGRI